MIWQNPWAWLGLVTLGLPVVLHMLSRTRARVQRFPTLRFLPQSRTPLARPATPRDLLLLMVRLAILAAAVTALAQPLIVGSSSTGADARLVTRAILVDTSASMQRTAAAAEPAVDVARWDAAEAARGQGVESRIFEAAALSTALAGAAAWLQTQPGMHEIFVFSDFQRGAIDSVDLDRVPGHMGLDLRRVAAVPSAMADAPTLIGDGGTITVNVSIAGDTTRVAWQRVDDAAPTLDVTDPAGSLAILHAPADAARARAALRAAAAIGRSKFDAAKPVTIVFPGHDAADAAVRLAGPLDADWMGDVILAVHEDEVLAAASRDAPGGSTQHASLVDVVRTADGLPVVRAAGLPGSTGRRLMLLVDADAGSAIAAAVIAVASAATYAPDAAAQLAELEPASMSDDELAHWSRPAGQRPGGQASSASLPQGTAVGRWLWLLVLLLIGVETVQRRRQQ